MGQQIDKVRPLKIFKEKNGYSVGLENNGWRTYYKTKKEAIKYKNELNKKRIKNGIPLFINSTQLR